MTQTEPPLLEVRGLTKQYDTPPEPTVVLKGVDLDLSLGDSLAIVGPSGCGKSTLLHLVGALDRPSSGSVAYKGEDLLAYTPREAARFRNRELGFVLQDHHLLPQCSVLENVLVPTLVHPGGGDAGPRAVALLERVGLGHRIDRRPAQLSGGERQRVAVVRALINGPSLLLADEPTGSLNQEASETLASLLLELNSEQEMGLIVVTHAMPLAARMGRIMELREGVLHAKE